MSGHCAEMDFHNKIEFKKKAISIIFIKPLLTSRPVSPAESSKFHRYYRCGFTVLVGKVVVQTLFSQPSNPVSVD